MSLDRATIIDTTKSRSSTTAPGGVPSHTLSTGTISEKNSMPSMLAFWLSNIGMIGMTGAFAVAGVAQVYLERKLGMDFLLVQKEIEVHFLGLILAASLFTVGISLYIYSFIKHGIPKEGNALTEASALE